MSEINYSLWEVPPKPQKKIQGIGYSSTYVTKEEKKSLSYKIWHNMINACYSKADSIREKQNGNFVSCCNSWLDYRKFQKWFDGNYNGVQGISMTITRCLISNANLVYNPNKGVVPASDALNYKMKRKGREIVTNLITDEQIEIAKDKLSDNLKLYMMFSLSTAIRIEDLLILKWDQIDIKERTVHIDDKILYFNEEVAEMLQKEKQNRVDNE